MRIKLVTLGGADEDIREAYNSFARAKVAEFVARPGSDGSENWPAILRVLADMLTLVGTEEKYSQDLADQVDALTDNSVAIVAAMCGKSAQLLSMTPEQMIATHDAEGDAPTGYAIASFMLGRKLSSAELGMTAHILHTMSGDQRRSLVSFATACLAVIGYTSETVAALNYPGKGE